ncbi:MAG TPA: tripartite tricarboxylate transporter substrate-binding protein, partial [Pseudomonadota bacterium]|nr:tripartite tricarboxylate transporter substrate-binding protein [Pseudomonadota bacterium]
MPLLLVIGAMLALMSAASAAPYPSKPITVIVPFAAGGPTDVVTRLIGDHMSRLLGQTLVVENVGGAGGTIGMTRAAQAQPDGYTIAVGNMGTQSAAPALYPNLKYDPAKSFAQVGIVNYTPQAIVAKKATTAANLKEFIQYLEANQGKLNYGHAGVGSISHVAGLLFNAKFGLKPNYVPYRGTGPALQDLVAGQIDYMVDQSLNVIPQIKAGTIKVYAVAASERLASLPDVPTTGEAGVDFIFSAWNGMVAPEGTPMDIVGRLADALGKA